ncbi:MAG: glycoside hydrolase family 3 C-terminal domain-containing protein [Bacteroidales bacterium]|nr:glycoside hydrolase family 3 C-terminal domain-containing protein [Bacteroidales bacterium]
MKKTLTTLAVLALSAGIANAQQIPAYLDKNKPLDERVEDALSRMTTEEKVAIIHAQSKFGSPGVKRLGIPEVWTDDGPHGVRPEVYWDEWEQAGWTNDSCVAFPALTCLAASWNPDVAYLYGKNIGEEARYRNKHVLLGPGVNILRTPLCGRNFEYMGEDPYLAGVMCVPYIQGLQSNGVAACVKHYCLNNQEVNRHTTNVKVDDRTLYELYLPAFKAAVDGGAWTVMGAYNLYKDQHNCHNEYTLNGILKGEWGFDGALVSDWGGTHDTDQAITNGLDMEFGSWTNGLSKGASNAYDNYYLAQPYLQAIKDGRVGTKELDDKARRVLKLIFRTAMNPDRPWGSMLSPEHYAAARQIGDEGIVLLQNNGGLLPIKGSPKKILVVGENAVKMMTVGGGSSSLKVQREVSPLQGLIDAAPEGCEVVYARGYVGDIGGEYNGVTSGQNLADDRTPAELIADAVAKAKDADYVIFVGGLNKASHQDCEDSDRAGLELPYGQDEVISALAAANPNLVVVNISGNPVAMPWVAQVPAIVQAWYLGSEAGNSIADVLYGRVCPSGKLPMTFPVKLSDVAAHSFGELSYPGIPRNDGSKIVDQEYLEGLYVGYKWNDKQKIKPLFPFGHGLSYTTFEYGKLTADKSEVNADDTVTFTIPVTNTGSVAGSEIVQLYISDDKASVDRPAKELKGFAKVNLAPGETKDVTITIGKDALSFFDPDKHQWVAEPGTFTASAAASADDIRSTCKFKLK